MRTITVYEYFGPDGYRPLVHPEWMNRWTQLTRHYAKGVKAGTVVIVQSGEPGEVAGYKVQGRRALFLSRGSGLRHAQPPRARRQK